MKQTYLNTHLRNVSFSTYKQQGNALVEGLIAILILSIGVLAMLQYQVRATKDNTQATQRINAVQYANEFFAVAEAETDASKLNCYVYDGSNATCPSQAKIENFVKNWAARVKESLPGVKGVPSLAPTVSLGGDKRLTITLKWKLPSETETHQYISVTDLSALN